MVEGHTLNQWAPFAALLAQVASACGAKGKATRPETYMPRIGDPRPERLATLDECDDWFRAVKAQHDRMKR